MWILWHKVGLKNALEAKLWSNWERKTERERAKNKTSKLKLCLKLQSKFWRNKTFVVELSHLPKIFATKTKKCGETTKKFWNKSEHRWRETNNECRYFWTFSSGFCWAEISLSCDKVRVSVLLLYCVIFGVVFYAFNGCDDVVVFAVAVGRIIVLLSCCYWCCSCYMLTLLPKLLCVT